MRLFLLPVRRTPTPPTLQPGSTSVIVVVLPPVLPPLPAFPKSSPHLPPHASSFAYIFSQFVSLTLAQSVSCSVCQLLSLSCSQLFSLSVCQSLSQLFPVVCLHYLLLRRLHTFDLPPPLARLDSIFFAYNSPASKRERYV